MKASGTYFVPTIVVSQPKTMPFFERIGSPPWYLERVNTVGPRHFEALRMAIEEGVKIGLGTDQFPFEENDGTTATVREMEYYVEAGMTPARRPEIGDGRGREPPGSREGNRNDRAGEVRGSGRRPFRPHPQRIRPTGNRPG